MIQVRQSSDRRRHPRGMVLIVVAVVTAMVTLSALGFLVTMKAENRAAHLQADQMQTQMVADSADALLLELAGMARQEWASWGGDWDNAQLFQDVPVDPDPLGVRSGRFSILSSAYTEGSSDPVFHFGVTTTSQKLSLAQLLVWDSQQPGVARMALMNLPGMNPSVADAILDWIDPDDEPREFGAEAEFYLGQNPPRQPPNRVPARIDELLSVKGVTAWQLLGNQNGQFRVARLDGADSRQDFEMYESTDAVQVESPYGQDQTASSGMANEGWNTPSPPWSYFLTATSRERDESYSGEARIYLNEPDLRQLKRQLTIAFDESLASFIVAVRKFGPSSRSISEASSRSLPADIRISGEPQYEFESALDLVDLVVEIETSSGEDAKKRAFASPFRSRESSSLERLVSLMDRVKVNPSRVLAGRINIMSAPRAVLLGIPNANPEWVDRLIEARQDRRNGAASRVHSAWMLAEGIVDVSTMKQLLPYVTVGGTVLEAQVVAYYDADSPWSRHYIVVDGTRKEGRILVRQDLRQLGRGFRFRDLALPVDPTRYPSNPTNSPEPSDERAN